MTLKELRNKVKETNEAFHAEQLENGCYEIVAQAQLDDALLMVLKNGIVVYKAGRHITTFSISQCGGYVYYTAEGERSEVPKSEFEFMDWTIRLLMEGEKRMTENMDRSIRRFEKTDGLGKNGEITSILDNDKRMTTDFDDHEPLKELMEREAFEELISCLTENQKIVARALYWEDKPSQQVAQELGKTYNAIRHMDQHIRKVLRQKLQEK